MKVKLATAALLAAGMYTATLGCGCGDSPATPAVIAAATERASFTVEGMTCASCSVTVRTAVDKLDGVGSVDVDVAGGKATVAFDPTRTNAGAIAEAISHAGYPAAIAQAGG